MKILGIETSCDETAISIIEASGDLNSPKFSVLAQLISSQIDIHQEFGGVVPNLARREHAKNILPLVEQALTESNLIKLKKTKLDDSQKDKIREILSREEELIEKIIKLAENYNVPDIDAIAVTEGPGLEPALWVGINTARALAYIWNKPVLPVNHMLGHLISPLLDNKPIKWPVVALLVSGGHTELVLAEGFDNISKIGQTRDDAAGEAFDKVARLLDLPYPGGPEISKLANLAKQTNSFKLPRPMMKSDDLDFSFSGLKTAVLYTVKDKQLTTEEKNDLAYEFQEAVVEVLTHKTLKAIEKYSPETVILAGGVSANERLQEKFKELAHKNGVELLLPEKILATDNATMIAMAGFINFLLKIESPEELTAQGNLSL